MGVVRSARGALGTLAVGVLFGYAVAGFAAPFLADSSLFGGTGESREARQFMLGTLQRDPELLASVTPGRGVVQRALESQTATTSDAFRPVSLTFIGGRALGRLTINAYAVELRPARGADRFFPLVLTLVDGKVVRRD